jgi:hypothetical protein
MSTTFQSALKKCDSISPPAAFSKKGTKIVRFKEEEGENDEISIHRSVYNNQFNRIGEAKKSEEDKKLPDKYKPLKIFE